MRHLTGLRSADRDRIGSLLDRAQALRQAVCDGTWQSTPLAGRAIALAFFEPSTRTRCSFEVAVTRLGGHPLRFESAGSSLSKGESLLDTARLLQGVGAAVLVVRHPSSGAARFLAARLSIPVINAGDGSNEHPTQALLDLLTLRDELGTLAGRTVVIVGDVMHSRVARSNCFALRTMGAKVILAGPGTLCPPALRGLDVELGHRIDEVLPTADAIMMLRIQRERIGGAMLPQVAEYREHYGLTASRAASLAPGVPILHPAPMNRGVEVDDAAADGPSSVVFDQMANGVFVRMACLLDAVGEV